MFGIKELLIILVVVILLFGTKKLRSLGSDLGTSVKGFKKALNEESENKAIENDDEKPVEPASTEAETEEKKTD